MQLNLFKRFQVVQTTISKINFEKKKKKQKKIYDLNEKFFTKKYYTSEIVCINI